MNQSATCPRCGGTIGVRSEDEELVCLLCGERQGPTLLPPRLVMIRQLESRRDVRVGEAP